MSLGGMKFFDFGEFGFLTHKTGVYGSVVFRAEDTIDGLDVAHVVTVKVRVRTPHDQSIADMREALFQKAMEQLRHALSVAEGKSAQLLLSEAADKAEAEQWKPDFSSFSPE